MTSLDMQGYAPDYLAHAIERAHSTMQSAASAKENFFLTPADLKEIQHVKAGGWGCGAMKLYRTYDLRQLAHLKHGGEEGLAKKVDKRRQRQAKKRKAEDDAKAYLAQIMSGNMPQPDCDTPKTPSTQVKKAKADGGALGDLTGDFGSAALNKQLNVAPAAPAPAPNPGADVALVKCLRQEARRALKELCTWDFLRSRSSPHGTTGSVRIGRVDKPTFAALIGRAADPELRSIVRSGAWYSVRVSMIEFFGGDSGSIRGSGGRYNGNSQLGINPNRGLVVKYSPSQQQLSIHAEVSPHFV